MIRSNWGDCWQKSKQNKIKIQKILPLKLISILTSAAQCWGSHAAPPWKTHLGGNMTEFREMVSKSDKRINSFRSGKCHWSRIVSTESVLWLKCSFCLQFFPCSTVSEPEVCCMRAGRKRSAGTKQHRLSPSVRRTGWPNPDSDAQQIHVSHL